MIVDLSISSGLIGNLAVVFMGELVVGSSSDFTCTRQDGAKPDQPRCRLDVPQPPLPTRLARSAFNVLQLIQGVWKNCASAIS